MRFEFLIVCHNEKANVEFLRELLGEVLTESYEEVTEEELENMVRLNLLRAAPDAQDEQGQTVNRSLCAFDIELSDETPEPQLVLKGFTTALADTFGVEHVLKFYDDNLLNENLEYMRQLFSLEMRLRKTLSLIYLSNYADDLYNLLRDETEGIQGGKGKHQAGNMELLRENEFFHLNLSQYIKLNKRKNLKDVDGLLSLIQKADSFEQLREDINREPVADSDDRDLLASLKQRMDPVEKLRNCVAHNRTASEDLTQSYKIARDNLTEGLEEFLRGFEPETT